jgi:hypothetical protein
MNIAAITPEHPGFRFKLRTLWLLAFFFVFGCHHKTEEEWDKEFFDWQVRCIKTGHRDSISLYDVKGTDALLHSIAGLKGVKGVSVEQMNDITDAGLKEIAALPDLTRLDFYETEVTDKSLQLFNASPKLEALALVPSPPAFSIATVLALPHLRKLSIEAPFGREGHVYEWAGWLDSVVEGLREAKSLEELTLTGPPFVKRRSALVALQKELPNCKIKLLPGRRPRAQPIPLTDD